MFGLGHIPDVRDDRDWHAIELVGAIQYPDRTSWLDRCAPIVDQPGNSCVGQAAVRAAHTNAAAIGLRVPYGSGLAAYSLGRAWMLAESLGPERAGDSPLFDTGSRPRSVIRALKEFGIVAADRWPDDAFKINDRVPLDVLAHGSDARIAEYYRADDGDIRALVASAVAAGHCAIFASDVYDSFFDYQDGVYVDNRGSWRGSHMMAVVGYSLSAPIPYFEVVNSWGTGWGKSGVCLMAASYLESMNCRDRLILVSAPVPS